MLPYPYLKREGGPDDGIRHGGWRFSLRNFSAQRQFSAKCQQQKKQQAVWLEAHMLIWEKKCWSPVFATKLSFKCKFVPMLFGFCLHVFFWLVELAFNECRCL